jgi:MFS transporter, SP family, general alpha glucoside:H+ symporter
MMQIYTFFRIPEPTGRSYAELDLLFERRVPARKFASTQVDVFDDEQGLKAAGNVEETKVTTGEKGGFI